MKTTLLLMLSFLVLFQVRAQQNQLEVPTIEKQEKVDVPAQNRFLMRRLLLNEKQYLKVKEVNTERNEMLEKLAQMYHYDSEKYQEKVLELEKQYDAEFERILTTRQFNEYLALNNRKPEEEPQDKPANAADELNADGSQVAVEMQKADKPAKLSFNDQIHAILEKATAVKLDSSLIAQQDTTDMGELSLDESQVLDGLLPQNATLIATRKDTSAQKVATSTRIDTVAQKVATRIDSAAQNTARIARNISPKVTQDSLNTGEVIAETPSLKPSGECKTCYAVEPDSIPQKSKMISMKLPAKSKAIKVASKQAVNPEGYDYNDPVINSEFENSQENDKAPAGYGAKENTQNEIVPAANIRQENEKDQNPESNKTPLQVPVEENPLLIGGEAPDRIAGKAKNENSLQISAEEVNKLKESFRNEPENGRVSQEETSAEEPEAAPLNESLPLNKSLAEEIEP